MPDGSWYEGLVKWDGSTWTELGPTGAGISLLAASGTNLYALGSFPVPGPVGWSTTNDIARWDGSNWVCLGSGLDGWSPEPPYAHTLVTSGNDLYVGGSFTTAGGTPANNIAKWDGSSWSTLGSGVNGAVDSLAADGSGHLFVGGRFSVAGTNVSPFIAQANLATTSPVPPHFENWRQISGQFGFDLDGPPGRKLLLQASTDLASWTTLWACELANAPLGFIDPDSPLYPRRFYRLVDAQGLALIEQPRWLAGQFNLNLAGELGRTVVVEPSTNLLNWLPLATNTFGANPLDFTDPSASNFPARFCRTRFP